MPIVHPPPVVAGDHDELSLAVLRQFRVIFGSVRQHFREVEQQCGVSGSQLWLLHGARTPGIGVSALAQRLSIHQSLQPTGGQAPGTWPGTQGAWAGRSAAGGAGPGRGGLVRCWRQRRGRWRACFPRPSKTLPDDILRQLNGGLAQLIERLARRDDPSAGRHMSEL